MFISLATIVLLVGVLMFFVANMKISGTVTALVGLSLMGAVHIPVLTPAVQWVNSLF